MNKRTVLIEQTLRSALQPLELTVIDDSAAHVGHVGARGGGGHFNVRIVAQAFAGKSALERHRLVYTSLAKLMQHDIHALSIKALTPEEI